MSEIEKMYENAGIKPIKQGYCDWDSDCPYSDIINNDCDDECPYWKYEDEAKYPQFTAEKQLKILCFNISSHHKSPLIWAGTGRLRRPCLYSYFNRCSIIFQVIH